MGIWSLLNVQTTFSQSQDVFMDLEITWTLVISRESKESLKLNNFLLDPQFSSFSICLVPWKFKLSGELLTLLYLVSLHPWDPYVRYTKITLSFSWIQKNKNQKFDNVFSIFSKSYYCCTPAPRRDGFLLKISWRKLLQFSKYFKLTKFYWR